MFFFKGVRVSCVFFTVRGLICSGMFFGFVSGIVFFVLFCIVRWMLVFFVDIALKC